jgi:3-phosphoglycerate kinase
MGKRMGEEVNKISTFFINKNTPSLAIIGGNLSNVQDKLLLIYSLLDTCQTIQIVGKLFSRRLKF